MKINGREIHDPIDAIDDILTQIKKIVIVGLIIIFMLLIYLFFSVPKPKDYITMQSPVRVKMAEGLIINGTLIEVIQYAIDEEWTRQIADEERKN